MRELLQSFLNNIKRVNLRPLPWAFSQKDNGHVVAQPLYARNRVSIRRRSHREQKLWVGRRKHVTRLEEQNGIAICVVQEVSVLQHNDESFADRRKLGDSSVRRSPM